MFNAVRNLIGYSGSSNMESIYVYICGAVILLLIGLSADLIYKAILSFFPSKLK